MVFESEPAPLFHSLNLGGIRGMSIDLVAASFRAFAEAQVTIRDSDRFAIDLFNTSFLVIEPDVRLVTLVMAVEALLEPREQSRNAVKLVDSFIKTVTDCNC